MPRRRLGLVGAGCQKGGLVGRALMHQRGAVARGFADRSARTGHTEKLGESHYD